MAERIVVGLGNPGPDYACTRHNAGFMVVERLARRWRITLNAAGAALYAGRGTVAGVVTHLVEPQQYMNRSGEALRQLDVAFAAEDLVVIYDDLDLPAGQLRVRRGGGSGGHRGVASIVENVGADFDRVRVGIGRPPLGRDAADYVLEPLTVAERDTFDGAVESAADAVECLLSDGLERTMNRFNTRQQAPDTAEPSNL